MQLSKVLFWDTDMEQLDWERHAKYVIERVIQRGTWSDFKTILEYYGRGKIIDVVKNLKYLDMRSMHFCSVYFKIPLTDLRCYNIRQSRKLHWDSSMT